MVSCIQEYRSCIYSCTTSECNAAPAVSTLATTATALLLSISLLIATL